MTSCRSQLALSISSFHSRTTLYFFFSIAAWLVFVAAYSYAYDVLLMATVWDFYRVGTALLSYRTMWFNVPVCVLAAVLPDFAFAHIRRFWWPTFLDFVQEWDRCVLRRGGGVLRGCVCWLSDVRTAVARTAVHV